ncbi:MAG: hypothetical protein HKP09_03675, partial [Enterobacterales bacterium]|nr:hypothetical protein [Enterobacterales bacterium]
AQNSLGDIIVGGEEGKLFWKPNGTEWQDMSLSHDVQIAQLKFYKNDHVDMVTKSDSLLTINRAKVSPILDWQELNRFTTRDGWKVKEVTETPVVANKSKSKKDKKQKPKSLKEIASIELTELNKQQYINVRTISRNQNRAFEKGDLEKFAYYPDSWKVFEPEVMPDVTTMIQAGSTKLGITEAGFWSWTGRPTFSKYNSATNSWQEISTSMRMCPDGTATLNKKCPAQKEGDDRPKSSEEDFSLISVPLFFNETDALAIVNFSDFDFWSGERSNDIKILKTTDGGKNWLDTGNTTPTKFCTSLITEISDRLLVSCSGATGDFYESFDEGKTWQNVRQQLNF